MLKTILYFHSLKRPKSAIFWLKINPLSSRILGKRRALDQCTVIQQTNISDEIFPVHLNKCAKNGEGYQIRKRVTLNSWLTKDTC